MLKLFRLNSTVIYPYHLSSPSPPVTAWAMPRSLTFCGIVDWLLLDNMSGFCVVLTDLVTFGGCGNGGALSGGNGVGRVILLIGLLANGINLELLLTALLLS